MGLLERIEDEMRAATYGRADAADAPETCVCLARPVDGADGLCAGCRAELDAFVAANADSVRAELAGTDEDWSITATLAVAS